MALEEAGIATVAVHTHVFARLARATALANGMPTTRQAFVPQPVVDKSASELRAYIEGADPVAKRPFVQVLLEGLTRPLDEQDLAGVSFERSTPRLLDPDTEDNLQRVFLDRHWTDCLPIVLPTEARVAAMLTGTSHAPDEVVGRLRPARFREFWEFTVEKAAVNAVMAGARPEYFPAILALAASGVTARPSSTTSMATVAVVNGPFRSEVGMDAGIGVMGPYNHANATIGRAYGLLSQNLQGGSVPGESYMGSLGNWNAYSCAFPENEERSPWEPLHVQKGFRAGESTVSVFFGARYTHSGFGPRETWQEKFRHCFASFEHYAPLIVLDPLAARLFVQRGFATKQQLVDWCAENARLPAREYWDDQWIQTIERPRAIAGVEPYATRLKAQPDQIIQIFEPDEIDVVVTGGETQGAWRMYGCRYEKTVSIDAWR